MRKNNRKLPTSTVIFTRSEFMLWASLLEGEAQSPLAQINATYRLTIDELQARVEAVVGNDPRVTDQLAVTG